MTDFASDPRHAEDAALLCEVRDLLADAGRCVDEQRRTQLSYLQSRLDEPLTIAVAGRTNAGKSTLVNALIGAQVAPTRETECTRVVTSYRFGPHQPRMVLRDGSVRPVFPVNGRLPDKLGVPPEQIERIDVWVDFAPLSEVTVIDTPGLSGDVGLAGQTGRMLASGFADVLVLVLGEALFADEVGALECFRRASTGYYNFPGNALGVVSRADQLGGANETWHRALQVAAGHTHELASRVAGVVPVMGKLAETTETGAFDEEQAGWLRTVAGLPDSERRNAVLWAGAFDTVACLPAAGRAKLLDRLDMHGIRVLTGAAEAGMSTVAMREMLRSESGIAALRRRLDILFVRPAAIHKAVRALSGLERLLRTTDPAVPQRLSLLGRSADIRDSAPMHTLAELRSLAWLYSGQLTLGDERTTRLACAMFEHDLPWQRLGLAPDTPSGELVKAAQRATNWWTAYANAALYNSTRAAQLAQTASWSAHLISTRLLE